MVFRLEESVAAVCAPSPGAHAALLVCQAVFESSRYLVYAAESLLVVLVEAPQPKSRFELWQVWNAQDAVRCVRFNPSKKAARGALALCIDEGRGVLLMPASATSSRAAAVAAASRGSALEDTTPSMDLIPRPDYVKAHLHLHLPRWAESVRWKCDDRLLNHLEWVESGDDLFLLGAGEKLSIWKLVDDSVQVYLQRTVTLSAGGGPELDAPLPCVTHFDVAPSGRFAATAGLHDRIVKLWTLGELSPHEGAPMSMFLPHSRALESMTWSKDVNVYNARATVASTAGACEMLFTLDRAGNISIWRENVAALRSFVLWKQIAAVDLRPSSLDGSVESCIRVFGLVNHYWGRETPKPMTSINEALLSESTVMDALCLFHYGYGSLDEARRNGLVSQRMDSVSQMNAKLLGDRSGAVADTHVGETFICGNAALEKTFAVHLLYGVLSNGDFCIFRAESIPFTGVSPRLSLILNVSDLREQLADAHVYNVSTSDYQDQASGAASFFIELLFQQKTAESYLQFTFASFDVDSQLTLWKFADLDELLEVTPAHRVDVGALMQMASKAQKSHMEFHLGGEQFIFKHFSFSSCGRVAILFGGENDADDQICFLPAMESSLEGVVDVPHKQFGQVVSLEWTPSVTPERDCELLFLSTTTIGMLKFDCSLSTNKWSIAWSSSRFSVRPENISSLSSYPYGLLRIGSSLAQLNLRDIDGVGSSPLQLPFSSSASSSRGQNLGSQPPSKAFPAHHPITMIYLLARGSFETLEKILDHVKAKIVEHEETCYLRMADDTVLRTLPLLSLSQLLGDPAITESKTNERSDVYLRGKERKSGDGASYGTPSTAPARASDLFMDFGASRRYGASASGADRADMLFAPKAPSVDSIAADPSLQSKSKLETDVFLKFFNEHKNSLSFMTAQETEVFLTIVAGMVKTVSWERDSSRQKDEAALRFHASLLWPIEPPVCDEPTQPITVDSDAPSQQQVNETSAPKPSRLAVAGLCSEQVAWGALSDFQSELLQECFPTSTMSWKEMRRLRVPFWLKSSTKLVQFAEKVAQAEYAANRDPFAVAVFYVLLGKTRLLASLFKMAHESRISELLSNNFADLRWKNAAIKNAYVLKTKQRYELSAAFFLLGGKVTEAVSVAEQADETLVLSFLIARISEKWELGGQEDSSSSSGVVDFSQASFTGLSTSLRGLGGGPGTNSGMPTRDESSEVKNVCVDFLGTTVWTKASERGDVYMCFLVKYFLGEKSAAIDALMTPPAAEMRSVFGFYECPGFDPSSMYWSSFGKSLLGACDLLRFLRKTIIPMKLATKEKIVRLNTSGVLRMQDAGLGISALIHQRDIASFVQELRRERATSADAAAFLGCRHRVLIAAVGNQVDFLYATFLKSMHETMTAPASSSSSTRFDLEERLNEEIQCIVRRGGDYQLPGVPETSKEHLEHRVRAAVIESLVHSGRLAALDFLISGWSHSEGSSPKTLFTSPLPRFVEVIAEGVATVASGDLMSAATDYLHTRKVDQTCSNLLAMATRLLLWLQYFYLKSPKQRAALPNREFVRVAVAAVHSAICICCRYLKNPCCLYRVLGLIFPHKDGLPSSSEEALNEIAAGDICVSCAPLRRSATIATSVLGASSLQQDIPVLYQAVCLLELELDEFTAAVKTSRLHHPMPSRDLPTPLFAYCSYWGLVLTMAAGAMPAHLSKITGEAASTADLSKKLVEAWSSYSNRLAGFALKHLLCDLAGFFFSPFSVSHTPTSPGAAASANSPGSPRGSSSPLRSGAPGSPRGRFVDAPGSPPSPQNIDRGNRRQLLKCECERCPWLLLVELFTNKNELLLRLNAQLECCSEKIDAEVRWGRLPEPASRKAALTRSQKLLLSTVAENASTFSRATNLTDQLKRRMASAPTTTAAVHVQCVYRSETNIKAMCFNRAAGEDAEVSVCSSKGIFRASCMDYADGCRFQFKGMYAPPQTAFFSSDSTQPSPVKGRQTSDAMHSGGRQELSPSSARGNGPPSPLRNPAHLLASPSEPKSTSFKPTAVASHPFLPLFVSGNHKGRVHLWSYDRLSAICSFQTKDVVAPYPTSPSMLSGWRSIKALEFDSLGQQLGAVDAMGHLFLWKFSDLDRAPYYREIVCHDKGAKGLAFLNSSSSVATVGLSSEKRNVCVWDTLLPSSKALVAAPACHPAGATSVAFSSTHQLLVTGGAGGALSIFDMRQRRVLHTISNAHETPIKTLVLHPSGDCVLSGSAGGDVKIWSLPIFREVAFLSKVHVKPSFLGDAATNLLGDAASNVAINVTNSSWGVTDAVATKDAFFSSGTDGSVQRLRVPSLGTRI
ncbi:hypothetical protein PR003_g1867 [Phytophthora rubi]|uniref:RAVE complex protein Rav1 C-terminal domain-containing protein n=3 Tax=Phytophthora rubi TaxID=129364 RepID=A0A6A4FUI8_9STRA|nr:hypothetical protein PR003_g1867 [Phytophthora rubi]